MIWLAFVAFLCGGLPFSVPSFPSILAFLPVPSVFTLSGVFSVHGLCLLIRASIWAFSNANLFAFFSFISFFVCNLLAFSSASILASFSFNYLSVSVAIFLSCNTSFKSHFIAYLGISSLTILSISISSLSSTFCLCFLSPVLGFIYFIFAKHLLVYSTFLASCLFFYPLVLYCIIFVLAKSK